MAPLTVQPLALIQLLSCEHYRKSAARRAKSLGTTSVRVPRCKADGEWERVQCGPGGQGPCWCVDEGGAELPATRAPSRDLVNCTVAEERCPAHSCRMLCPLGFALDEASGCPRCECRDPCAGVQCPRNQQCRLQDVACRTQPCPPVPTCKRARSLEELCPVGSPLSIADTRRPFLCGNDPGKPDCPPMYRCLVQRGNEYGVCCPASLHIRKPGTCPNDDLTPMMAAAGLIPHQECTSTCQHDLQCPGETKCCQTRACGGQCRRPENATACHRQRLLSEVLAIGEREGRGYIPQCDQETGMFLHKQCSRNGLVCWCVHPRTGDKLKGTMGSSKDVDCPAEVIERASGRSLVDDSKCDKNICAAVCEYGFKDDENGCPTCECEEPCSGYNCPAGHSCTVARDASCEMGGGERLCESVPVCRPDVLYSNPCTNGAPLTLQNSTQPVHCDEESKCPADFMCTSVPQESKQVCCPIENVDMEVIADKSEDQISEATADVDRVQTMCEYLRDFSARMEGTVSGLELALPAPTCDQDGSYAPVQCEVANNKTCWCVDRYGTELPKTRTTGNTTRETCEALRESVPCLEVSCRMGCDYDCNT
ncbi:LOW QUALITY PROTEIN: multiple epidermal growth factor-like domains protein 6 [Ctenocephalides felis]|uniref:LOW QUALITY PROTEIN: multiple epidermal growth factor-like domains protein 6 n=1 Tax=Ctenocephalides felis TaxID=7515 RepID=UPI000E6E5A7E|nr:LOW QUALITY PROTEIN: multiple epidermal growth factor-like domains protein 6 [Ctenocephalides felis]